MRLPISFVTGPSVFWVSIINWCGKRDSERTDPVTKSKCYSENFSTLVSCQSHSHWALLPTHTAPSPWNWERNRSLVTKHGKSTVNKCELSQRLIIGFLWQATWHLRGKGWWISVVWSPSNIPPTNTTDSTWGPCHSRLASIPLFFWVSQALLSTQTVALRLEHIWENFSSEHVQGSPRVFTGWILRVKPITSSQIEKRDIPSTPKSPTPATTTPAPSPEQLRAWPQTPWISFAHFWA